MSHENLANAFRETVLAFTWRQWGQLGVSAAVNQRDRWCQDPEALLLFTLEVARREPRMFDEVIDWLAAGGPDLMRQRLVNLLRDDPAADTALVSAALESAGGPCTCRRLRGLAARAKRPHLVDRWCSLARLAGPCARGHTDLG